MDEALTDSAEILQPPAPEQEEHFRTDHLQADLVHRSLKGGVFTFAAQMVKLVLNFASVMAMARLLELDRKTVRYWMRQETWVPYQRPAAANT